LLQLREIEGPSFGGEDVDQIPEINSESKQIGENDREGNVKFRTLVLARPLEVFDVGLRKIGNGHAAEDVR
jgi:hypothetical protein